MPEPEIDVRGRRKTPLPFNLRSPSSHAANSHRRRRPLPRCYPGALRRRKFRAAAAIVDGFPAAVGLNSRAVAHPNAALSAQEAPLRFEGVVAHGVQLDGVPSPPDIVARRGAWRSETAAMMATRGVSRTSGDDYRDERRHVDDRLPVEDLHSGNVLVAADGTLLVIEPVIYPPLET